MTLGLQLTTLLASMAPLALPVSDHGDAPLVSNDQGTDIGDIYLFVDPTDNSQLVVIMTTRGFLVPGEAGNFAFFQSGLNYRFGIENTGDATEDASISVTFAPRPGAFMAQDATIAVTGSLNPGTFTAPTTAPSLDAMAPDPVTTTDMGGTGITFFAGVTDDPFFFDVVGFSRFLGSGDGAELMRGRDTFAGYNTMSIALSLPIADFMGSAGTIGVSGYTELAQRTKRSRVLGIRDKGTTVNVDRAGIPAVNSVLVPFARKDEYNRASTVDDMQGLFADDIIATLMALGTPKANIDVLAGLAVTNGDYLRIDPLAAGGFPNGRQLPDDVIDIILGIVTDGAADSDSVDTNDVAFDVDFPFLAPPFQPRMTGVTDDGTRN